MRFSPKTYVKARSTSEVVDLLAQYGEKARIVGGGTTIYGLSEKGLLSGVEYLIDLSELGLNYMKETDHAVSIGCSTTLSELEASPILLRKEYEAFLEALKQTRPVQVKNVATIGGNISSAIPFFDPPIGLAALDAKVQLLGPSGNRTIPLEEFYVDLFTPNFQHGEFLSEVILPKTGDRSSSAFTKFASTGDDWASINVAARVSVSGSKVKECRIFLGGLGVRKPTRAVNAERFLQGKNLQDDQIDEAGRIASGEFNPMGDFRASSEYRKAISNVLVKRTLGKAAEKLT